MVATRSAHLVRRGSTHRNDAAIPSAHQTETRIDTERPRLGTGIETHRGRAIAPRVLRRIALSEQFRRLGFIYVHIQHTPAVGLRVVDLL